jgi:4-hydroxybenzoate polyprenyltransferase
LRDFSNNQAPNKATPTPIKNNCNKAEKLGKIFGIKGFDYVGNSYSDIHVWKKSRQIIVSNCSPLTLYVLKKNQLKISRKFQSARKNFVIKAYFSAMRPQQWIKNFLIFIPAIVSRQFELATTFTFFSYFLSFSLLCSSVYIFNDLLDLESDRSHEFKSNRAIASGNLKLPSAFFFAIFLGLFSLGLSFFLSKKLFFMQLLYLKCTSIYSIKLKDFFITDCLMLAFLYTLRVLTGMILLELPISLWLTSFSIMLFFSLAILKRFSEIKNLKENYHNVPGRNYKLSDSSVVFSLGIFSSLLSLIILALYFYTMSLKRARGGGLYNSPLFLFLSITSCFYWFLTIWKGAFTKKIKYDPIVFTFTNLSSILSITVFSLSFILALYF